MQRAVTTREPVISLQSLAMLLALVLASVWVLVMLVPFAGDTPKAYWYLSRAGGFVALALLWLSMMFGLLITSKTAPVWPGGPQAFDLHQFSSSLSVLFALFHALILLGDRYIGFSLAQLLVPFAAEAYEPLWIGIGQIGLYLALLLTLSYYARRWITQRGWRVLHYASFAVFGAVIAHSTMSGTDSDSLIVRIGYIFAALSVLLMTALRVVRAQQR